MGGRETYLVHITRSAVPPVFRNLLVNSPLGARRDEQTCIVFLIGQTIELRAFDHGHGGSTRNISTRWTKG